MGAWLSSAIFIEVCAALAAVVCVTVGQTGTVSLMSQLAREFPPQALMDRPNSENIRVHTNSAGFIHHFQNSEK